MFFKKEVIKPILVEVEKVRPQLSAEKDIKEAVQTLAAHPGFQHLLAKLKLQRNYYQALLVNERHAKIEDVQFLQAAVYWSGWLESMLTQAVHKTPRPTSEPSPNEVAAFEQAMTALELVGQ